MLECNHDPPLLHLIKSRILREWRMTLAELDPRELWRILVQAAKDTWRDIKELVKDADNQP